MVSYEVHPILVHALVFALRHYPENLPTRWKLISEFVVTSTDGFINDNCNRKSRLIIGNKKKGCKVIEGNQLDHIDCKKIASLITKEEPSLLKEWNTESDEYLWSNSQKNGHKPIIILPSTTICINGNCSAMGSTLGIRNRPSFPIVYTNKGPTVAALYSATCSKCSTYYSYSYFERDGCRTYFKEAHMKEYFQTSTATLFSCEFMNLLHHQIVIGGVSFQACSEIYNAVHAEHCKTKLNKLHTFARKKIETFDLNEERLEEAWFLLNLIEYFDNMAEDSSTTETVFLTKKGTKQDIDDLCRLAYDEGIWKEISKWQNHECSVAGCRQGYVTIDGSEKLRRPMCAAPRTAIKLARNMPKVIQCCPKSPIVGNQSQKPSPFCVEHEDQNIEPPAKKAKVGQNVQGAEREASSDQADDLSSSTVTIELPDMNVVPEYFASTQSLPNNNDESVHVGCKLKQNVDRFYNRTAGILTMIKPCGIIVDYTELFTCESPSQVFVFLLRTCTRDWSKYKYIGYDRACELEPFLQNLAKKGNYGAQEILSHVTFVVDYFHCIKHTRPTCMPLENNPLCKYHPRLPMHDTISNVNTECAEQCFKWLNNFKGNVRRMTQFRYKFFLWVIIKCRNEETEKKLKKKGKM